MEKRLCVFCGSSESCKKEYLDLSRELGLGLAEHSWNLVYGGASVGPMGALADGALEGGSRVYGVIPDTLVELEVAHQGLTELFVVETLHVRKQKMYDLAHVFLALPGGLGTMDELCEVLTWAKLGYQDVPIFLLNYKGFFDSLFEHFSHVQKEGFLEKGEMGLWQSVSSVQEVFGVLEKIKIMQ